jgi:isocitrate dehydrogenase
MFDNLKLKDITPPSDGEAISYNNDTIVVPNNVVVPFIEGDGVGFEITPSMQSIVDASIKKAYGDSKKITWFEVYAGEKCYNKYKDDSSLQPYQKWLHPDTLEAFEYFKVGIKGPLTTPIGEGMRSINVAIRQNMDLYACVRPVKYFGNPSPVVHPEYVDMIIFRENTEDLYAGVEFKEGTDEVNLLIDFLQDKLNVKNIRFPKSSGIGIKPISKEGTDRLIRRAYEYAIAHNKDSITIVHKGNIMKFTEGAFRNWSYELAQKEFGATVIGDGPWCSMKNPNTGKEIIIKDVIADAFLQEILLKPREHQVIATMNLNGDYSSDALAAMVGGIGIAPGANLRDDCAVFEATHGTAPNIAGDDIVNPSSLVLSAEMMLRHLGWDKSADILVKALRDTISQKRVTKDFSDLMDEATEVKCSEFTKIVISNME